MRTRLLLLWLLLSPALQPMVRENAPMVPEERNTPPVPLKGTAHLITAYMGAKNDQNTVLKGHSFQLHIVGVFSDETTAILDNRYVVWGTQPHQFISVDQNGIVTGVSPGVSNVTAHMNAVDVKTPVFSNWWTVTVIEKEYKGPYEDDEY